jgi:hypothetical protein
MNTYTATDLHQFKGDAKTAAQTFIEAKIDELLPGKTIARTYLKKGLNNWLSRQESKADELVDMVTLFAADEKGDITPSAFIDDIAEMLRQTEPREYHLGNFDVAIGAGEVVVAIPSNPLADIFFGDIGKIRLTAADFLQLKTFF